MSTITVTFRQCDHCQRHEPGPHIEQSLRLFWMPGAQTLDLCADCRALGYIVCKNCYRIHLVGECPGKLQIIEDEAVLVTT